MKLIYPITAILIAVCIPSGILSQYADPTGDQFHIQTDEGPERYFRYQTHSGQYRKEKRLEDGTVIGSYGWIDQNGLLRLREYIADNAGYRILKSKNVYVGKDRSISQAIKAAKKVPANAGSLVKPSTPQHHTQPTYSTYANTIPSTTPRPSLPCANCNNPSTGYTPNVEINHHSLPSSTERPFVSTTPSPISPTGSLYPTTASPIYIPSTTPSPTYASSTSSPFTPEYTNYVYSTPAPPTVYVQSTPASVSSINPQDSLYLANPTVPTLPPQINSNSLDNSGLSSDPQYEHYEETNTFNPYVFRNGPTYPIDKNGNTFTGYNSNSIGQGNNYQEYDGVSVTNDGFRYYIPRAYHEEQQLPGDQRTGSFGYIDPFGIRRVVYYNAAPGTGFVHRKNNRYVGFNAAPYDPRPY